MTALEALEGMSFEDFLDALTKRMNQKVLLGYKEVTELTGLSAPTIRKLFKAGKFPKPFIGTGAQGSDVRFLRSDIVNIRKV